VQLLPNHTLQCNLPALLIGLWHNCASRILGRDKELMDQIEVFASQLLPGVRRGMRTRLISTTMREALKPERSELALYGVIALLFFPPIVQIPFSTGTIHYATLQGGADRLWVLEALGLKIG